jgi:hypothetical protein
MRVVQALDWFKDDRANEPSLIDGIVRYLDRTPRRGEILADLQENKAAMPTWMCNVIEAIIQKAGPTHDAA